MWSSGGAYNAWADYLERWGAGENPPDDDLPALAAGDFEGDTWERLVARIDEAMGRRLRSWGDTVSRAVGASRDEFSVGRSLAQARDGLRTLRRFADHPSFESEIRATLLRVVDDQVRDAQRQLEDQVDQMRRDGADARRVDERRRTIRDNSLTAVTSEIARTASPTQLAPGWFPEPGARPTRRIIVD